MQTKVLVMEFVDSAGKKFSIRIADPREDITPEDVQDVMDLAIDKQLFNRADLVSVGRAYVVATTQTDILF
ncbi:MAG: DUF2922 domain-containing protein [Clostridium sp.]|nr:DUF2922 domain-containing protein [Clostridium sp.]